ncbi:DNA repair protein RAD51 homolog 2-like [Gigantopelta aegis]|uniref:DNA repair protein RAD51 homolog 2-like n=1 Tax=Gigantopelta aegis TaxID=1735272 RepID=UPI001B889DE4|nr:DNA repair protein RAD51 homolog 2-like [Gigantopelta aegis]
MSTKRLRRVGLPKHIIERFTKLNICTCKDVLSKSFTELLKLTASGSFTVHEVIQKCSIACVPSSVTALSLWKDRQEKKSAFLMTSLPELDRVLHGGLLAGTITEIAGPAGSGKTQFCVMLSVLATLPRMLGGLEGSVLYIDTEGAFSAERLLEIARSKYCEHFKDESTLKSLAENVYVDVQQTCSSLLKRLQCLEQDIISKRIKLVIIDSIASLVRKEFSTTLGQNLANRTNFLSQEAAILKYTAEVFSIPIVVTNQITTRFGPQNRGTAGQCETSEQSLAGDGSYVTVALGNTWSHSVNTRLILQYLDGEKRQVMVAKSPISPFTAFIYTIQDQGIVEDEGGAQHYKGTDPGIQHIQVRSALPICMSQCDT